VTLVLLSIRIKPRAGRYLPGKMPYDQAVHTSPAAPGRVSRACCSPVAAIALRREAPWPLQRLRSCRCTVDPEEPQKRLQTFSRSCSGCRPISSCSYSPTGCSSVAGALPHCSPGRRRRTPGLCTTAYCTIFHSSRFTLRHGSCWMAGYGRTWLCSATPPSGRGASRGDRLAVSPEGSRHRKPRLRQGRQSSVRSVLKRGGWRLSSDWPSLLCRPAQHPFILGLPGGSAPLPNTVIRTWQRALHLP